MDKIALVTATLPSYSETFIQQHMERLPAEVLLFHSAPKLGYHPIYGPNQRPLFSAWKPWIYAETAFDRITGEKGWGFVLRKRAMTRLLQQSGARVVLAEYGPVGAVITDVCQRAGVPLVVHFHGLDAYRYATLERFRVPYQRMFKAAAAIIAVSEDMRQQLIGLGAPPEKVLLNPYGPNFTHFQFAPLSEGPPLFLSVGRFTGKKAPHLVLQAFAQVVRAVPEARLTMVADGPLWESSKALAKELGIADQVSFPGSMSPAEIGRLHHQARAFVQHSVRATDGDSEGTPVAILEAMQSGLPIIATRHAGIKDVVVEGETGLLVDEGDVNGMAQHMIALAQDRNRAAQMGRAAHQRIRDHYTLERHLDYLWSVLQKAMR